MTPLLILLATTLGLVLVHAVTQRVEAGAWPPYLRDLRGAPGAIVAVAVSVAVAVGAWLTRTPRGPRVEVPPPSTSVTTTRTAGAIITENGTARRLEIERAAEDPDPDRLAGLMRGQR